MFNSGPIPILTRLNLRRAHKLTYTCSSLNCSRTTAADLLLPAPVPHYFCLLVLALDSYSSTKTKSFQALIVTIHHNAYPSMKAKILDKEMYREV